MIAKYMFGICGIFQNIFNRFLGFSPQDGLRQKCSTQINFCETYAYHANGNPVMVNKK